jgi:hypothetical protein
MQSSGHIVYTYWTRGDSHFQDLFPSRPCSLNSPTPYLTHDHTSIGLRWRDGEGDYALVPGLKRRLQPAGFTFERITPEAQ